MADIAGSLQARLEKVLGITTAEASKAVRGTIEDTAVPRGDLVDAYRDICDRARAEIETAHQQLFDEIAEVLTPVNFIIQEFERAAVRLPDNEKRLFNVLNHQFTALLARYAKKDERGDAILPAGELRLLLKRIFRPSWWRTRGSPVSPRTLGFFDLQNNLETMIRLTPHIRNSLAWAFVNGFEDDPTKSESLRKSVAIARIRYAYYEHAFPPEIRRAISYKDPSALSIANKIFGVSGRRHNMGPPALGVVRAAKLLGSSQREQAVKELQWAFSIRLLLQENGYTPADCIAFAVMRLAPLHPYVTEELFSAEQTAELGQWLLEATPMARRPVETLEEQVEKLTERVNPDFHFLSELAIC